MAETNARSFRFALSGVGAAESAQKWRDFARKAEDLGYALLVLGDHLSPRHVATLPALVAAGQVTTRLRFGTTTLVNDFRYPAILAKEAATVDLLTDGRFEFGIGTGAGFDDRRMGGLPQDPPGVQVERLHETLKIVKAFFAEESVTFRGKHYQVEGLPAYPRTVQGQGLPILIGAVGPRMLRFAARAANIVSILAERDGGPPGSSLAEKMIVVREAAGDRYGSIELNRWFNNIQIDGEPPIGVAPYPPQHELRDFRQFLPDLIGSREQVIEQLVGEREQFDMSYVIVPARAIDAFAPVVARLAGT